MRVLKTYWMRSPGAGAAVGGGDGVVVDDMVPSGALCRVWWEGKGG